KTANGNWEFVTEERNCNGRLEITNAQAGTSYCYRLVNSYNGQTDSDESCAAPPYERTGFTETVMTQAESAGVLETFDWRRTDEIMETYTGSHDDAGLPMLYYMNILIDEEYKVESLQKLGIHMQAEPVFYQELAGWHSGQSVAVKDSAVAGRWYFALVPGSVYNGLRQASIDSLDAGESAPLPAVVFRKLPVTAAMTHWTDEHQASHRHLGEQGFEFNGTDVREAECQVIDGVEVCPQFLGWLARKVWEYVDHGITWVVDGVRQGIGRYYRALEGEVTLSLELQLVNTDPLFGAAADTRMTSGWSGNHLYLRDVEVHVRQGAGLFKKKTDGQGRVSIDVARDRDTQICVQAENDFAKLTEFIGRTIVCLEEIGEVNSDQTHIIPAKHDYLNMLAQFTDAADYLEVVAEYEMNKITVLVGDIADWLSPKGNAFAPCMGRLPGGLGLLTEATALALLPVELLYSVDIVMPPGNTQSRGVATHEYGHTVMCDMMGRQGSYKAVSAWHDVVIASLTLDDSSEPRYIAEAFADYITSQVAGGTNYFQPNMPGDPVNFFGEVVHYCQARDPACLDANFTEGHLVGGILSDDERLFRTQIRRVASTLHDAFDGYHVVTSDRYPGLEALLQPNDGSHWIWITDMRDPNHVNTPQPVNSTANNSDISDETVALDAADLIRVFEHWGDRSGTLTEEDFLGALAETIRERGYPESQICHLFGLHSATARCPGYAGNSPFRVVAVDTSTVNTNAVLRPYIDTPDSIIVEATGPLTSVVLGPVIAMDDIYGPMEATSDSDGLFTVGKHIITWMATNPAGISGSAQQIVEVRDTTAPEVVAPADIVVEATGRWTHVDLQGGTATDLVDGVLNAAPTDMGPFRRGRHMVTWTATDSTGNTGSDIQIVEVVRRRRR
ncbi:MAG: hypothetical protein WBO57_11770, partial [Gammaproteobacteria bacterium]